jgi:hypothetical protein
VRRQDDPLPGSQIYARGRDIWLGVANPSEVRPQYMQFGYNGHNYLGFADMWSIRTMTDEQALDLFSVSSSIRNNAQDRAALLHFMRINQGSPAPTSTTLPAPATRVR